MNQEEYKIEKQSILDTVSYTQTKATLQTFNPLGAVLELLGKLTPREREVLVRRYGLETSEPLTLETIGKNMGLTRERIRQIEKETIKKFNRLPYPEALAARVEIIFQIIENRGNVTRESSLLQTVLAANDTPIAKRGTLFILHIVPRFTQLRENHLYHPAWYVTGFDRELFEEVIRLSEEILAARKAPTSFSELLEAIRKQSSSAEIHALSGEAVESYVSISKKMDKNPYGEWGSVNWPEIRPRDVGDKAYLVLLHSGKPEHYEKITEMINKQRFDYRLAQKESVHNELIKDNRFVLVGRGIYALTAWGYHAGIVADIIAEIIGEAGRPLNREEIIKKVLEQRLVKRNTVVVGLSNRKRFVKTPNNKYTIV